MAKTENKKTPIFEGTIRQEHIQQIINLLVKYKATNYSLTSISYDMMHLSLSAKFDSKENFKEFCKEVGLYMCRLY